MGSATFSVATFAADHPEFKDLYMTHGKSAYQAAVELGFKGTEEEWIDGLTEVRFGTYGNFTDKNQNHIYVDLKTDNIYRYDPDKDDYKPIGGVLGETSDSAYRGDRGKIAYDHAMSPHAPADAQKNSDITKGEIEEKLIGDIETHRHNAVNIIEDPKRRFITDEERAAWNAKAELKSITEANLYWGGRDLANEVSPIDAAMVPELSANRLAHMTAKDITIEYSRDDGETWTDYWTDVNDENKTYLTTLNNGKGDHYIGKWESGETPNDTWKLRVTLIGSVIHCHAKKIALIISTNGSTNCKCLLERSYNSSKTTFEEEKK